MPVVKSLEELKRLKEQAVARREAQATTGRALVTVHMGTCGIAAGARDTMKAIIDVIASENLDGVLVKQTGCIGRCEHEPIVDVENTDGPTARYGNVSPEDAARLVREHVVGGSIVDDLVIDD